MHIELLGPLRIYRYGSEVSLPAKTQKVFAALVLNAGSIVPTTRLVDELWGDQPPVSALRTVQTYVYHIRKRLQLDDSGANADDGRSSLITRPGGYEFRLAPSAIVDTIRFDGLLERARLLARDGAPAESVSTIRAALDLWHGQPFTGLETGPLLSVARVRLEQARRSALEQRVELELQLGQHKQLIDEMYALVADDPSHESFSVHLMIALHRSGRRAESLNVYHRLRRYLAEEFGVVPSGTVRQTFQEILDDSETTSFEPPRPITTRPRRSPLPPCPRPVGRHAQRSQLRAALARPDQPNTLRVVEIVGEPGAGTTSFALHAAHELGTTFGDGCLLLDLKGVTDDGPVAARTLGERLTAAGVPMTSCADLDDVAEQFRGWSRTRELLLVADHLATPAVLTTIRPSGPNSALVVINQSPALGQVGDDVVEVPPLTAAESLALLTTIAGATRVEADSRAAARLAELCAGNPLVLSAVARWMTCRPHVPVARLVRELETDPRKLARLWWAGRCLEDSVRERVRHLTDAATETLAALRTGTDTSLAAVATRLSREAKTVEATLEDLTDTHLVEEIDADEPDRRFRLRGMARLVSPWIYTSKISPPHPHAFTTSNTAPDEPVRD
ncbi:MAG: AfsR/SARP family transcriptional regulator [Actinophytocola sp.]|uniref:AfsR/SARP family transcriptional regulator n=1 Tax=Actinophytocola sp. TaxID=1872138 RepID=UPI003C76485D